MEVCQLSTKVGVPLFCGFNRRSDSQYLDLKRRVDAGVVGRPMLIKSTSRDYPTNWYVSIGGRRAVADGSQAPSSTSRSAEASLWISRCTTLMCACGSPRFFVSVVCLVAARAHACRGAFQERPHTVYAMGSCFYEDIAAVPDTGTAP